MTHDEHRARQAEILDRTLARLKADPRVLGVVAVGSWGAGTQDAFSDLDLACYLRDEPRTGRAELCARIGQLAPVLCQLWLYDVHALFLFENGVRLDLDIHRPGALAEFHRYAGTKILHDPDGILGQKPVQPDTPPPAEHPRYFTAGNPTYPDWFFWMFRQIVCWTKRGAQGGYRSFDKLAGAVDSLAQVRQHLVEMNRWTMSANDYVGRLDPGLAERLSHTYPHLASAEILACTSRLLDEYDRICPAYCRKAGLAYPAHKVAVMRRLMAEFAQLPCRQPRASSQ